MERTLIIGAGAQAKYAVDIIRLTRDMEPYGIVDVEDNPEIHGTTINGIPILGALDDVISEMPGDVQVTLAHGNNQKKRRLAQRLQKLNLAFVSLIHPKASVSESAKVGDGVIICANSTVMPNARIGHHVMIHANTVVEHDDELEDLVNLAPGVTLAGYVTVKRGAYVYTGASVIPNIVVGEWSIVGAGATVLEDVAPHDTVVGTPARSVKNNR